MKYPDANLLCVRRTFSSLQDSCYADLMWAADKLGVSSLFRGTINPLKITYQPTGQVILFRGMDKAEKLASITVPKGYLCWVWFEEFFQITNEGEFDKLAMSIRGYIPPETGLFKQITCTFNPWSEHCWIKKRFFDRESPNVFTDTTTYKDNEFLDAIDIERYEQMYIDSPRRARIVCDGDWGISEGLIYEILENNPNAKTSFGLDFGYSISYNAFICIAVDMAARKMWIFDEMYDRGMSNIELAKRISRMGYNKEMIFADCAEPKSIYELQAGLIEEELDDEGNPSYTTWALPGIRPAMKGNDSVMNGIQRLQSFRIIVHPSCQNTIVELSNYAYDQDKDGKYIDKPIKEFDHLCLTGDTLIITKNGDIPLKDIKVGDEVMTNTGWRKVTDHRLTEKNAQVYAVYTDSGKMIRGTYNHKLYTPNGKVMIGELSVGDNLIAPDCTLTISKIVQWPTKEDVYNITVDEVHNYFANGILSANCDAMRYASEKFFIRAHGAVAEAKGMDKIQPVGRRSKRVVSA